MTDEVLWMQPQPWRDRGDVVPIGAPIPLEQWLLTLDAEAHEVRHIPRAVGAVSEGPAAGGQVVIVETDEGRGFFALAPAALLALDEYLSANPAKRGAPRSWQRPT